MISLRPFPDFRAYLGEELARRISVNPRYSLRAFARALKIQSSYLSKILRGERRVTPKFVARVTPLLSLGPEISQYYQQLARRREPAVTPQTQFQMLSMDFFAAIANWYHYALLELIQLPGFRNDAEWMGATLNLSPDLIYPALDRLKRLKLIDERDGRLHCVGNFTNAVDPLTISRAQQNLQKEILTQAIGAMETIPPAERDQSSLTMACPSALLPQVKERIKKFRRELGSFVEGSGIASDRVYHFSVSLYPVSRVVRAKEEMN